MFCYYIFKYRKNCTFKGSLKGDNHLKPHLSTDSNKTENAFQPQCQAKMYLLKL